MTTATRPPAPIKDAAIRRRGLVYTGRCHADIIRDLARRGLCRPGDPIKSHEQGFTDRDGRFLTREQAYARAVLCGQLEDIGGLRELRSEMLEHLGGGHA